MIINLYIYIMYLKCVENSVKVEVILKKVHPFLYKTI
jgi:hypothetical protein